MANGVKLLKDLESQLTEKTGLVKGLAERAGKAQDALGALMEYSATMQSGLLDLYRGSSQKIREAYQKSIIPGVAIVKALLENPDTKGNAEDLKKSILQYQEMVNKAYKANSEEEVRVTTYVLSKQLSAMEALGKSTQELTAQKLFE